MKWLKNTSKNVLLETSNNQQSPEPSLPKGNKVLVISLLLGSLGLYLGIAAQLMTLVCFVLLVPFCALLVRARRHRRMGTAPLPLSHATSAVVPYRSLVVMGTCFCAAWLCFPFFSVVNWLVHPAEYAEWVTSPVLHKGLGWALFLKSPLSSGILVSGIFLIALGVLGQSQQVHVPGADETETLQSPSSFLSLFIRLQKVIAIVFFAYLLLQHLTGFDFHPPHYALLPEHRMASGLFRVFGFYGHPLSLAAVALFLCVFWMHYFMKTRDTSAALLGGLGFAAVVMSGGRTALVVALLFGGSYAWNAWKPRRLWTRFLGFVAILLICLEAIQASGLGQRIKEFFVQQSQTGIGENRLIFWKVHGRLIAESPLTGWGTALVHAGWREFSYTQFGYGALRDKFNAHNLYLEILTLQGLLGIFFLALCSFLFFTHFRRWCSFSAPFGVCGGTCWMAGVVANALHGFTQNTYFDANVTTFYMGFFWVFIWLPFFTRVQPAATLVNKSL